eukprot:GHVH01002151.1.p1 GENE.GHVH01002151.1~~GHVH01002151.1.p1  ORF type:complete len:206 (-),score=31.47 GHVH01002151.1:1342-1959(-)
MTSSTSSDIEAEANTEALKGGDSNSLELHLDNGLQDADKPSLQKNAIMFSAPLIASIILVVVFGPMANMCSKWAFTIKAYTVKPSEITDATVPQLYDDNIAQIMFKHTTTMLWCLSFFIIDTRLRHPRNLKPWFTDSQTIDSHKELDNKDKRKMYFLSAIPAACDFGFSALQSDATKMIRSSTVQMIANLNVLMVACMSMLFLKK